MKKFVKFIIFTLLVVFSFNLVNAADAADKVIIKNVKTSSGGLERTVVGKSYVYWEKKASTTSENKHITRVKGIGHAHDVCRTMFGEDSCTYEVVTKLYTCKSDKLMPDGKFSTSDLKECKELCGKRNCIRNEASEMYDIYKSFDKNVPASSGYSLKNVDIYRYLMIGPDGSQDEAYCVQPQKKGPGLSGKQYCLSGNYDLSQCDDRLNKKYYCGLAQIMFDASEEVPGTDERVIKSEYDYSIITTALRFWVAFYSHNKSSSLGGIKESGNEVSSSYEPHVIKTAMYLNTATAIVSNGYTGGACAKTKDKLGIICDGGTSKYRAAITLFLKAYSLYKGNGKFLDGYLTGGNDKFDTDASVIGDDVTLTAKWTETFREQWEKKTFTKYKLECSAEELLNKNSDCRMFVEIIGPDKKPYKPSDPSGGCDKEKCTLKISYLKELCKNEVDGGSATKWEFNITLKSYKGQGYFREYKNCSSPNNYQVMYTTAFNRVKSEKNAHGETGDDQTFHEEAIVSCPCTEESGKCSDFTPRDDTHPTCSGQGRLNSGVYDSYDKMSKSDPYMNCILNPCNQADKEQFNMTKEYGLNEKVCNVYCRKEVVFYLANKRKVYAGMQFKYDIGPAVLGCESTVNEIVKEDAALTSIVLQKRQCASEIYYDIPDKVEKTTWLKKYDDAVHDMLYKWTIWKMWEKLRDDGYTPVEKTATNVTGCNGYDCGCDTNYGPDKKVTMLFWPDEGSHVDYTGSKDKDAAKDPDALFNIDNYPDTAHWLEGRAPLDDGNCGGKYSYCPKRAKDGGCETDYVCRGSCRHSENFDGKDGTDTVTGKAATAKGNYENARKYVAQLLFDLQDCNFYVKNGTTAPTINEPYGLINSGSAKEYIMGISACDENGTDECVDMTFEYDDELYGKNLNFGKEVDLVKSKELNQTYFCMNGDDSNPNCYKYIKDNPNEIKDGSKTDQKHYVKCTGSGTGARCQTNNITLPKNDYATFITITESDFWLKNTYSANAYTGLVDDAGSENGLSTPLGKWQFPVSNGLTTGGTTGTYDTRYHFDNVKIVVDDNIELDYTCSYDVYNTTNLYDCATRTKDGNLDLSACTNTCYQLVNGVPVIKDDCNNFDLKDEDSKGYGFVYRNVNLDDLFPNSDVNEDYGKNNRPKGTNWSSTLGENVSTEIEAKGSDMYLDENNLKYSFILTPTAIKRIREYNTQQETMGRGYQDSNFLSCELIKDTKNSAGLKGFYNCKSEFLNTISQPNNEYDVYTVKFSEPGRGGN